MRKFVIAFVLSFAALTALLTVTADAQGWKRGAAALADQNFTPIEQAACRGWGPHCPPGRHWVCRPRGCWCAPCW